MKINFQIPAVCRVSFKILGFVLVVLFAGQTAATSVAAASRAPVRAPHGIVVSTSAYASDVGLEILKKGGNAVDAAVAVGFALAVTHPAVGNIGGGGFMVVHDAARQREFTIDYRETAPGRAGPRLYLDEEGEVVEGLSTIGHLAPAVPGSVAGLHLAWRQMGKLPWKELMEPAIRLAREGFAVSYALSRSLQEASALLSRFPDSRRIFLRDGEFYQEGDTFRQPELAQTLRLIADEGPESFYQGKIARLIVQEMEANGGIITLDDLKTYQAKIRPAVSGSYRGYQVVSMGPPSSGGVVLLEMLHMMESFPIGNLGLNSSGSIHVKAEVMRRAFADRAEFLGDPDFTRLPVKGLLSREYAELRGESIRREWATPSQSISHGEPLGYESPDTTHYSIVDREGNGVSATTTINGFYGSGVTVRGAGFLLNNEMDDFTSKVGVPNMFGLLQGEANSIEPGKRPLSAMTPTLVKKSGKLFLVLGSPGGPTIINTVFQIILNVVDYGLNIQEAVDAPRIHHQWLPDEIVAEEKSLPRDVQEALRNRGHKITYRKHIGDAHSILIDPESGIRLGAPDPRSDSKASGY